MPGSNLIPNLGMKRQKKQNGKVTYKPTIVHYQNNQ